MSKQEIQSKDLKDGTILTADLSTACLQDFQKGSINYAEDAGSTDAYAVTLSPVPSQYTTGMVVNFKANTVNTGACTLNVNSLGAKTIKKNYNSDLVDGDIKAGQRVSVIYDGTNFQMISQLGNAVTGGMSNVAIGNYVAGASETSTKTCGFQPKCVLLFASGNNGSAASQASSGSSDGSTNNCSYHAQSGGSGSAASYDGSYCYRILYGMGSDGSEVHGVCNNFTLSGFDIVNTRVNNGNTATGYITWVAIK